MLILFALSTVALSACAADVSLGENNACALGLVACPTSDGRPVCVDLATNPIHCGACGSGCPRGACAEGLCCESFACAGRCWAARRDIRSARVGVETVWVHPADFDGDGRDDLFVSTNRESSVSIYWGRADGELTEVDTFQWGQPGYWLGSGDIDNDGRLDALLLPGDEMGEHLSLKVRFSDGRRGFERERSYATIGFNPTFAATGDVNGDQLTDVLLLGERQHCVFLMRGLGGGDLSEPRCVYPVRDATVDAPTFIALGRDAQGRSHWLGEGALTSTGRRAMERWVFSSDGASIERVEPVAEDDLRQYTRASSVRVGAQRMVLRFEVDGTPRSRRVWMRSLAPDLSMTPCSRPAIDLQIDGAGGETVVSAGDFNGDGLVDYFGLTAWCAWCSGMLYAHLGR
ncbi:MAG: FG-GAP-like repeat-containing protein [Polyangiales bacterium]